MKKGCLIGVVLLLSMTKSPAAPSAAEYRLAYVDLQKAPNLCKAGQEAKEKFSKKVEKAEQGLSGRQDELKKLQEVLEKQGSMLNEAALKEKKKDYEAKLRDFKRLYDESQEELKAQDNEAVKEILSELVRTTQSYGKEKGFTFVFEKSESALLFADEATEITDEIIKLYDASYAQGGKAATK